MRKAFRWTYENPCHVKRHVAVADDHHPLVIEFDAAISDPRVSVDPCDHIGGAAGTRQSHTLDVESAVTRSADCVEHSVVVSQQFVMRNMLSHFDIEVVVKPFLLADPVE